MLGCMWFELKRDGQHYSEMYGATFVWVWVSNIVSFVEKLLLLMDNVMYDSDVSGLP